MEKQGCGECRSLIFGAAMLKLAGRAFKYIVLVISILLVIAAGDAITEALASSVSAVLQSIWALLACGITAMAWGMLSLSDVVPKSAGSEAEGRPELPLGIAENKSEIINRGSPPLVDQNESEKLFTTPSCSEADALAEELQYLSQKHEEFCNLLDAIDHHFGEGAGLAALECSQNLARCNYSEATNSAECTTPKRRDEEEATVAEVS